MNETGARRRRSNPVSAVRWWCALLACVVGAAATAAAAPAPEGAYRWSGELVALDEAAGTVTLTAPMAAPAGREGMVDLEAGDPIVITWSDFEGKAGAIRSVMRDDGGNLPAAVGPRKGPTAFRYGRPSSAWVRTAATSRSRWRCRRRAWVPYGR